MRVYISADYSENSGVRDVVNTLNKWSEDKLHKVSFVDMAKVVSGSVSKDPDCRPCDLKKEFNAQINASSSVIIVIGDKTATRTAGSSCQRATDHYGLCQCTPYKQNYSGTKYCKIFSVTEVTNQVGEINTYSYIRHEFEQAKRKNKNIIVVYNSLRKESSWLPWYMKEFEEAAQPFWIYNCWGEKVGNYDFIKKALGYEKVYP